MAHKFVARWCVLARQALGGLPSCKTEQALLSQNLKSKLTHSTERTVGVQTKSLRDGKCYMNLVEVVVVSS